MNYIRHNLMEYDTHLEGLAGQVGVSEVGGSHSSPVYDETAAWYPEYAEECKRQMRARHGEVQDATG